jgi:outer membrane immunogenic protein
VENEEEDERNRAQRQRLRPTMRQAQKSAIRTKKRAFCALWASFPAVQPNNRQFFKSSNCLLVWLHIRFCDIRDTLAKFHASVRDCGRFLDTFAVIDPYTRIETEQAYVFVTHSRWKDMGELMRNLTIAAVAAAGIALGAVQSASAADIARPVYKAAPVIAAFNWSGFYIGGNIGYGWGQGDTNNVGGIPLSWNQDGFFGGGQIGWNWQAPGSPWVWGVEVDSQWANMEDDVTVAGGGIVANAFSELNYFGTARLRLGYAAWDRAMIYATGGLAWGTNEIGASVAAGPFLAGASSSNTHVGWTVGAGVEWALLDNWSAKVEYLYLDLGSQDYFGGPAAGGFDADVTAHTVKVGLNYRFGYSKAPVVAKY